MNELMSMRLKNYDINNANDEINAIKEVAQEIILFGLSQSNFFDHAYFCGGTNLRILHGLNRFSEDLDFSTLVPMSNFDFDYYMDKILTSLKDFGLEMKVTKSKDDSFVKARELKEDSEKWKISFPVDGRMKKVMIKLEIDVNPPAGCQTIFETLDFPLLHRVRSGTFDTLFAGKVHALLCRRYTKGRDWYDFLWYLRNGSDLNLEFLKNALYQMGPYQNQKIEVSYDFVKAELTKKVVSQDFKAVAKDVARFLKPIEVSTLHLWDSDLFLKSISKLGI